jgi:hypothetical protein
MAVSYLDGQEESSGLGGILKSGENLAFSRNLVTLNYKTAVQETFTAMEQKLWFQGDVARMERFSADRNPSESEAARNSGC